MYPDSKKIQLLGEILKENDNKVLEKIEAVLKKSHQSSSPKKKSAFDFIGLWSKEDSILINKIIEEGCGQIHPNDWK